jgi:hypothetical protein
MMKHSGTLFSRSMKILLAASAVWLTTSCLKDAPEALPDRIVWDPSLAFPLGDDQYGMNNVSGFDTTLLDLDTVTGLPKWVDEVRVVMQGNLDFGLSSIQDNLDHINSVLLRVSFLNGFPDEIYAQGYFEDAADNQIDSFFQDGPVPVPPGRLADNGEVLRSGEAIRDSYFDRDRIQPLEDATHVSLRAYFIVTEPDTALIPHYPEFELEVHVGAMFDLTMEF